MKSAFSVFFLLLVACNGGETTPTAVADDPVVSQRAELFEAAKEGDLGEARRLLSQGVGDEADINYGTVGAAVLNMAATRGDLGLVETCLAGGVAAESFELDGDKAPLDNAAAKGHIKVVEALLRAGADAGKPRPALAWAASSGHVEVVRRLIAAGADPDLVLDEQTPLFAAVHSGDVQMLMALLEGCATVGLEVTRSNKDGTTSVLTARQEALASGAQALVPLLDTPRPPSCDGASAEEPPADPAD
jgi:ankyrin repeat protein